MTHHFAKTTMSALALSIAMAGGTSNAQAQSAGEIIGGTVGTILFGCAVGALDCKGNKSSRRHDPQPSYNPHRQQNIETQQALNGFNFPVGTADGVLGRRSRAAIADYQRFMNYPATGQLTEFERNALVTAWQQYQSGHGVNYPKMMSAMGPRGLLRTAQDPNFPAQFGDRTVAGHQPVPNTWQGPAPDAPPDTRGAAENETRPIKPLKPLKPVGQASITPASHCELVELTGRTQEYITPATLTDPDRVDRALSEKFCSARSFAISQSQYRATEFAISDTELANTCKQIADAHRSTMTALPASDMGQVTTQARTTVQRLGLDQTSAEIYGQICLGMGYRQDDPAVTLGGALTLTATGQRPYGEVIAHHLRHGFGTGQNEQAAVIWYDDAMSALENGTEPAFDPSTTKERIAIIRAAIAQGQQQATRVKSSGIVPLGHVVQ